MFWIYDMSSSLLALLIVSVTILLAIAFLLLTQRWLLRPLGFSPATNEAVNAFGLGITALYSVTVGLIAVASWQNFANTVTLVSREASTLGVLYRDVGGYPEPLRADLRRALRQYTGFLIDQVWPAQQQGRLLDEPTGMLSAIHAELRAYHPADGGETIVHAEAMRHFDDLVDLRRQRVDRVDEGLPEVLWLVVGIGAAAALAVRCFLCVENLRAHAVLLTLLALFVGLLIYLIAALDRPFRGQASVSPDAYRLIIQRVMDPLDADQPHP